MRVKCFLTTDPRSFLLRLLLNTMESSYSVQTQISQFGERKKNYPSPHLWITLHCTPTPSLALWLTYFESLHLRLKSLDSWVIDILCIWHICFSTILEYIRWIKATLIVGYLLLHNNQMHGQTMQPENDGQHNYKTNWQHGILLLLHQLLMAKMLTNSCLPIHPAGTGHLGISVEANLTF